MIPNESRQRWKRFPNTHQKDLLGRPPSISKHGLEGFPFVTAKLQQLRSSYTADDGAKKCKKRDLFMAGIL